ncbi:alpha-tocopherol transfer protein-like [Uloborus diversus]|uniref:alpha-tocopherol transfer protein-like n=1 Tax=Uloborus diversus TaxID=327109 RepID=UPI00240A8150|nr:alpha-tocopherol transfer protein-like [Uloborus diversus]XP_054718158.1 alpha-tocopherol transfer protein-like [Uloborus diversus]XP_054718159.1 alpha-tocopherol transfer protein-like [Uloborus diversus]
MPNSKYDEVMKAKGYLPFVLGYLTDNLTIQAEKELNETEESRQLCLAELRKVIQKDSKLVCPTDDAYLLQYLRARKFNVKKAFSLLQNFYQVKKSYPELFDNCDLDDLRKTYSSGAISTMPYRDQDGCAVYLIQMGKWDPEMISMQSGLTALTCCILMCIEDCATQVTGVHIIVDVRGANLKQLRCLTPRYLTLFSKALKNCLPVRFKGIHIYNESTVFQYIWSVLKLFLTEKIKKRVHFHGDNQKQLHKFIPKAILPSEYGGDNAAHSSLSWFMPVIESFFERYNEIHTYGYSD